MVKHCCYWNCTADTRKDAAFDDFVTFAKSPIERVRQWVHLCKRDIKDFDYSKINKVRKIMKSFSS